MAAEPTMEKTRAIISAAPGPDHVPGSNWSFTTTLSVPTTLGPGEILVEMSGTGICHTDLLVTSYPAEAPGMQYPRVAGHEGAGYIRALGPHLQNQDLSVGDPVLLSFDSCAQCAYCASGTPAYCETFMPMNILGTQGVFVEADGTKVAGKYFGQSSFAALTVCTERSVLSAKHLVQSRDELNLFSPLGCGLQTGAGSVLNVAKPGQDDIVMILGLGGVGLSALMAAAILGCKKIIAVDRVKSRIELAKELGATDELDTTGVEDLVKALKEAAGGTGPTCVIDSKFALIMGRVSPLSAMVLVRECRVVSRRGLM